MQQSFRVLLVEDDDSLRVCLGEFLADHGWDVGLAASGPEAIELALRQRFDFSILDFHLPNGTTGLDVFRRLCALRPLPAILMSGADASHPISAAWAIRELVPNVELWNVFPPEQNAKNLHEAIVGFISNLEGATAKA